VGEKMSDKRELFVPSKLNDFLIMPIPEKQTIFIDLNYRIEAIEETENGTVIRLKRKEGTENE
jgi:hypothetical protein